MEVQTNKQYIKKLLMRRCTFMSLFSPFMSPAHRGLSTNHSMIRAINMTTNSINLKKWGQKHPTLDTQNY